MTRADVDPEKEVLAFSAGPPRRPASRRTKLLRIAVAGVLAGLAAVTIGPELLASASPEPSRWVSAPVGDPVGDPVAGPAGGTSPAPVRGGLIALPDAFSLGHGIAGGSSTPGRVGRFDASGSAAPGSVPGSMAESMAGPMAGPLAELEVCGARWQPRQAADAMWATWQDPATAERRRRTLAVYDDPADAVRTFEELFAAVDGCRTPPHARGPVPTLVDVPHLGEQSFGYVDRYLEESTGRPDGAGDLRLLVRVGNAILVAEASPGSSTGLVAERLDGVAELTAGGLIDVVAELTDLFG